MNIQPTTQPHPAVKNDDEIDLLELAKTFWNGRKTIIKSILIAGIFGVIIAVLSPKEYTATTTIVPQTSSSASNRLGGLSSLGGHGRIQPRQCVTSGEILCHLRFIRKLFHRFLSKWI